MAPSITLLSGFYAQQHRQFCPSVCLPVFPSHAVWYHVKVDKHKIMSFSPSSRSETLVFFETNFLTIDHRAIFLAMALNETGVGKNSEKRRLPTFLSQYLGKGDRYDLGY